MENTTETTALAMIENSDFVATLTERNTMFCSMTADTPTEKAALFKAMNNPEKRIGDCINTTIMAKDVFCETVKCVNKKTGEVNICPRTVIIDENGIGYQAVSLGVYSALKKLIQVFGLPTWESPLPVKVKQITKGDNKILTFDVEL